MSNRSTHIIIYFGGQTTQDDHGTTYSGGVTTIIQVVRGITLSQLRDMITVATGFDGNSFKITYRYPYIRYPHTSYAYTQLEFVNDSELERMFDIIDETPGYTAELYVELDDFERVQNPRPSHVDARSSRTTLEPVQDSRPSHARSSRRSQEGIPTSSREHFFSEPPSESRHRTPFPNTFNVGACETSTSAVQELFQNEEMQTYQDAEHDDEPEEDVDEELLREEEEEEEEDNEEAHAAEYEPPQWITENTWTNFVDPSPPLPTTSNVGWEATEELRTHLIFQTKEEVQNAVKLYTLQRNYDFKGVQSTKSKWCVQCVHDDCPWRLRAKEHPKYKYWVITCYSGPHICVSGSLTQDHRKLTSQLIANRVTELVKVDAGVKIKLLQAQIREAIHGYNPSYGKTWDAKQKALARIYGDWDDSYAELPNWMTALTDSNPDTQWHLLRVPVDGDPDASMFDAIFWAFGASINTFKYCRPVISIDGTFTTGRYKEKLLTAVTWCGENKVFPLAFAVVREETTESWRWFLNCIRAYVTQRPGLCLISDRHAGIIAACRQEEGWRPPMAYHRYCARHLGANYAEKSNSKEVGVLVKKAAMTCSLIKFRKVMDNIQRFNPEAKARLDRLAPEKWTMAHDSGRRYGACTTNLSESFNSVVKNARHLPITALVQATFYKCVKYCEERRCMAQSAVQSGYQFTMFAMKKYEHWRDKARRHTVEIFNRSEGIFEVKTPVNSQSIYRGCHTHSINLRSGTCTCQKIQQWRMPCSHVIAACSAVGLDPLQFMDGIWTTRVQQQFFTEAKFYPVLDKPFWRGWDGEHILPNSQRRRTRGRPQTTRMRNAMDWLESQPTRGQTCGLCGQKGHNRRKCTARTTAASTSGTID